LGSAILYRCAEIQFHPVNESLLDPETYARLLKTPWSSASQSLWVPYDESRIRADFRRLWDSGFLDNLWVEAIDEPYANGVPGKHVVFHLEERDRVKGVDYTLATGAHDLVSVSKIEQTLRDRSLAVRADSFIDESSIRKVIGVINELHADEGHPAARVTVTRDPIASSSKLVRLTFHIDPGPEVLIGDVVFDGARALRPRSLNRALKANRAPLWIPFLRKSVLRETQLADDAERLAELYKNHGYAAVQIGQPRTETLRTSADGLHRWVRLHMPVDEGPRYRVGTFEVTGESSLNLKAVRSFFHLQTGDGYSAEEIRKGLDKAKDAYGRFGFWEWQFDPELTFSPESAPGETPLNPVVDISIRMREGKQFFVNRITFSGNTNTHDVVARRELLIAESAVFNAEALKESVRRLNQLGYFKPLEGKEGEVKVTPASGTDDRLDVAIHVEEQNRNQMAFGAGLSQTDGFFGQLSFQTANFGGRGDSVSLLLQRGTQASQYQIAITEPYLFGRRITGGGQLYSRKNNYPDSSGRLAYSEVRSGTSTTLGFFVANYTRFFGAYTYEVVDTAVRDDLLDEDGAVAGALASAYLDEGRHIESRVSPSLVYTTVDHPTLPRRGMKATVALDFAGGPLLGGTTDYLKPNAELIWYIPHKRKTAFGLRGSTGWVKPFGRTEKLPYYQRYYLGGEYEIRGVDLRSVGPLDSEDRVLGGDKFVLFNAEYYYDLFGSARILAFHDAGQAFKEGDPIDVRRLRTSSGAELRFTMPVLNVPFRLIYAWNFYRDSFQPKRNLRFAVGTTF